MSVPDAPEPLDATRRGPAAAANAAGSVPEDVSDLAAIPTFLRDRVRAPIQGRAALTWTGPPTKTGSIPDAAMLPMAGIAPRRLVVLGVTIALAWLLVSFGRQVAEASAASSRAGELRAANAALTAEVAAMERELEMIQEGTYIGLAARGYRLGTAREIPFALQGNAPPLAADAPGSAAARLGGDTTSGSPVETWLDVLFGPGD